MRNISIITITILSVLASVSDGYAQQPGSSSNFNWRIKPFDHKIFIANQGQCNGAIPGGNPILYNVLFGEVDAYFTSNGMVYRYDESPKKASSEDDDPEDVEKDGEDAEPITHYLNVTWAGSNPNVTIDTLQRQTYYYAYNAGSVDHIKNIRASVFKEIVYRNIYPGIDADYTFPVDSDLSRGIIKYSLIVHPGADLSQVKLEYKGNTSIKKDVLGNVLVSSAIGTCTDHAPVCYYKDSPDPVGDENTVKSSYIISGNTESFAIGKYDHNRTLVIDPVITWTTNPAFTGAFNNAVDVDYDNAGNVYAYGGTYKFQEVMLNSGGAIQWYYQVNTAKVPIFNLPTLGNMAVDRSTGNSYISAGFGDSVWKINNAGAFLGFYKDSDATTNTGIEAWKLVYNPGQSAIVQGVGGRKQVEQFATATATTIPHGAGALVFGAANAGDNSATCCHDIVMAAMDPSWNFAYIVSGGGIQDSLSKVPLPACTPFTWTEHTAAVSFPEFINGNAMYYVGGEASFSSPYNGIAASRAALYLYDGETVTRLSETTGAVQGSLAVFTKKFRSSGLTVDHCDDLYVGVGPMVNLYDGLTFVANGTISMAVNTDTIYDLKLGHDSSTTLYASGHGFVASINIAPVVCTVVLPVSLLYFNCSTIAAGIELNWATASETNNKSFTIERSSDGVNFIPIATIQGAGNSVSSVYYKYIDQQPMEGNNYYRLVQTDMDGKQQYLSNTLCTQQSSNLIVIPNPSAGRFSITLPGWCLADPATLTIYDMLGRQVYYSSLQNQPILDLDVHQLASGMYLLKVNTSERSAVTKLVISK